VAATWARVTDAKHKSEIAWAEADQAEPCARLLEDEVRALTEAAEEIEAKAKSDQLAHLS